MEGSVLEHCAGPASDGQKTVFFVRCFFCKKNKVFFNKKQIKLFFLNNLFFLH